MKQERTSAIDKGAGLGDGCEEVSIELDIMSGRPNPRWRIEGEAMERLGQLKAGLRKSEKAVVEPPALGYRGFIIGRNIKVFKGYVQTPDGVLADPAFSIEGYLLESLPDDFTSLKGTLAAEIGLGAKGRGRNSP